MSVSVDVSERELRVGIFKLALSLVVVFSALALGVSLLAGEGQSIALSLLLTCVAFGFLTNGVLAICRIIDWFEARKEKSRG